MNTADGILLRAYIIYFSSKRQMSRSKENASPFKTGTSKQPSPDGRLLKELDRLCENLMPKEVALSKKLDLEKKRVRELEASNTLNQDKVRQLEQ